MALVNKGLLLAKKDLQASRFNPLRRAMKQKKSLGVIHAEQKWRRTLPSRLFQNSGSSPDPEPDRGPEAFIRPLSANGQAAERA
jgi:hypothetical protein